jgi:hypothetical protein
VAIPRPNLFDYSRRVVNRKRAERMSERERNVGLEPDDAAAKWLEENDPPPPPKTPKSASKNKLLHTWRRRVTR